MLSREAHLDAETACWLGSGISRDLVNYINPYWLPRHRTVSRVEVVCARRPLEWLAPIAESGGRPFKASALHPESDRAPLRRPELAGLGVAIRDQFTLVPTVNGALPDALSARQGASRSREANVWCAETDVQAISQRLR